MTENLWQTWGILVWNFADKGKFLTSIDPLRLLDTKIRFGLVSPESSWSTSVIIQFFFLSQITEGLRLKYTHQWAFLHWGCVHLQIRGMNRFQCQWIASELSYPQLLTFDVCLVSLEVTHWVAIFNVRSAKYDHMA